MRVGTRAAAGPFRSFGRIAAEPRPYQLVPLMMALKLDPVRLLIADDVGIGKTVEACLIARELLDRGEVQRVAVLCPPDRASIAGMDTRGVTTIIKAQVPMSEMLTYEQHLTSATGGRGFYHMEYSHYDEVPSHLQSKIIATAKAERAGVEVEEV